MAEATIKIVDARNLNAEAKAKVTAESYGEAFNLSQRSIRVAQEARVLAQASSELNLDSRLVGPELKLGEDNDSKKIEDGTAVSSTSVVKEDTESGRDSDWNDIEFESGSTTTTSGTGIKVEGNGKLKIDF